MGCFFSQPCPPKPYDYYHNGPLRYLGYAGHIGKACRTLLPPAVVNVPQMAATAYIIADVFDATSKSSDKGDKQHRVVIKAFDALIWQALASIIIPGLVLNGLRKQTKQILFKKSKVGPCGAKPGGLAVSPLAARFIPCALALLAIPLISRPIDKGVDFIMNNTYREFTKPSPDELKTPRQIEREKRQKAAKAAKEAKLALEKIKKAEKERLDKLKREENEAKEQARKKCQAEAKALQEKIAAEDRALKEKLKKEEAEFKAKQLQLEKELKNKANQPKQCA